MSDHSSQRSNEYSRTSRGLHLPISSAQLLLFQARQFVELNADKLGRKRAIMDVILDLRPAAVEYDLDALLDDVDSNHRRNQAGREYGYVFEDEESLHEYWSHQAHLAAMNHNAVPKAHTAAGICRFQTSSERSTVSWSARLDGDALSATDRPSS